MSQLDSGTLVARWEFGHEAEDSIDIVGRKPAHFIDYLAFIPGPTEFAQA
jgi:hypothetical protein